MNTDSNWGERVIEWITVVGLVGGVLFLLTIAVLAAFHIPGAQELVDFFNVR